MKQIFTLLFILGMFLNLNAQWERMSNINFNRNHGIGFSIDGIGYVLTGWESNTVSTKSFHKYDPTTDTWEQMNDYPGIARGYGIGAVYEDKLYFGFGYHENSFTGEARDLNDLWVYDPADDSFTELPSCPCTPRSHPAFLVVDGKVYMGTGSAESGDLNDWWSYDIESQEWTRLSNIPGERHHPYMFDIDGEIYVGSGHRVDWYKYDIASDVWEPIADLDDRVAGTQFSYDGRGYVLSGVDNFHDPFATGEFWMYDPQVGVWETLPPHPGGSRWAPASFIVDNYVYIVSGWSFVSQDFDREVWRYNLDGELSSTDDLKGGHCNRYFS